MNKLREIQSNFARQCIPCWWIVLHNTKSQRSHLTMRMIKCQNSTSGPLPTFLCVRLPNNLHRDIDMRSTQGSSHLSNAYSNNLLPSQVLPIYIVFVWTYHGAHHNSSRRSKYPFLFYPLFFTSYISHPESGWSESNPGCLYSPFATCPTDDSPPSPA